MQSSYGFVLVDLPVRPFVSTDITYQKVSSHWEKQAYFELRQQVFKQEQNLHFDHEKDANDFIATPIVAIANLCGVGQEVVGGVRVFKTGNNTWFGGRLCVKRPYRGTLSIGKKLINEAVTLAKKMDAIVFLRIFSTAMLVTLSAFSGSRYIILKLLEQLMCVWKLIYPDIH